MRLCSLSLSLSPCLFQALQPCLENFMSVVESVQNRIVDVQPLFMQAGYCVGFRHIYVHFVDEEGVPFLAEIPFHAFFAGNGVQDIAVQASHSLHVGNGAFSDFLGGNGQFTGFFDGFSHTFRCGVGPDDIVFMEKRFTSSSAGCGYDGQAAQQIFRGSEAGSFFGRKDEAAAAGCVDVAKLFNIIPVPCRSIELGKTQMGAGTSYLFGQRKDCFCIVTILWIEEIGNKATIPNITHKLYTFVWSHTRIYDCIITLTSIYNRIKAFIQERVLIAKLRTDVVSTQDFQFFWLISQYSNNLVGIFFGVPVVGPVKSIKFTFG